jgi:hypothetical protein
LGGAGFVEETAMSTATPQQLAEARHIITNPQDHSQSLIATAWKVLRQHSPKGKPTMTNDTPTDTPKQDVPDTDEAKSMALHGKIIDLMNEAQDLPFGHKLNVIANVVDSMGNAVPADVPHQKDVMLVHFIRTLTIMAGMK